MDNLFLFFILSFLFSLAIDLSIGELPTIIHPVVIIGYLTNYLKNIFIKFKNKRSGLYIIIIETCISSVIIYLICLFLSINIYLLIIIYTLLLSSTFSIKMLIKTAINVKNDLNTSLTKAQKSVSYLVSRNTNELTEKYITSATIESLTENISDSYIAVIFYYLIFSFIILKTQSNNLIFIPLLIAFLYRISNTLDAMLGYKTKDLINIGYIPAKVDDILNYIPSRLSGLIIILSSFILKYNWKNAYKIMKRDAKNCPSPNSGYLMAPTAGALNIQLIKKGTYTLGDNIKEITKNDITQAVKLTKLTIILFTLISIFTYTILYLLI